MHSVCVKASRGRLPSNGAIMGDTKQAMSEEKIGPLETTLTWPAATALLLMQQVHKSEQNSQGYIIFEY